MPAISHKGPHHEFVAHTYQAMNPPGGQIDAHFSQRFTKCQDVLVDTVDECAVEVEKKGGLGVWRRLVGAAVRIAGMEMTRCREQVGCWLLCYYHFLRTD